MEALKTHGYWVESVRLAAAIANSIKMEQRRAHQEWRRMKERSDQEGPEDKKETERQRDKQCHSYSCYEGWIGHSLDPMGCLFDTLAGPTASKAESDSKSLSLSPHFFESHLRLAMESALIGLGQQRLMPPGMFSQEKACQQEERLIDRLRAVDVDAERAKVLCARVRMLLECGPSSALGEAVQPESQPVVSFAKYLFSTVLPYDPGLAFEVGLRSLRLPPGGVSRWHTLAHIEGQQCALASAMMNAAQGKS